MILDHVLGKNILVNYVKNAQESRVMISKLVMIEEPSKKRVYWPLGKVKSLLPRRDGKVRTLKLKCKNSELIRPIQRVYPFEVPFINNEIVKMDGVPTSSVNEDKLTAHCTRAFDDGPRNFEPWSNDEDDTGPSTPSPTTTPTGE
ncbi:hypothetical protein TNCV_5110191 [Trichonephila clavipes]|nr:hypothetical protein TNCV_5110191 [Trichonephila clavipes]